MRFFASFTDPLLLLRCTFAGFATFFSTGDFFLPLVFTELKKEVYKLENKMYLHHNMYLKILKHATIMVKQQQHDGCVNVINRLIANPGD